MNLGIKALQNPTFFLAVQKTKQTIARNGDHIIAIQVNVCRVSGIMKSQGFLFNFSIHALYMQDTKR